MNFKMFCAEIDTEHFLWVKLKKLNKSVLTLDFKFV